jgi:hypothetical protein
MRAGRTALSGLLRWYPPVWRERYGEELMAMMEDDLGDRRPSARFRLTMAGAGLRERGRGAGLFGDALAPAVGVRGGSLLVLCAWTVFVLAGFGFSKLSEHFAGTVPPAFRALPWGAFETVRTAAVTGAILVVIGALVVIPAFVRFVHHGGWPVLRGHVLRAVVASTATLGATAGMVAWANFLTSTQRNGGSWPYGLAFLTWAALGAATLVLWTVVAVAAALRLVLTRQVLRIESLLAAAVTVAMAITTVATAVWWGAVALHAPWFLQGTSAGISGSPFEPRLATTMVLMLASVVTAGCGVARIGRSWGRMRTA